MHAVSHLQEVTEEAFDQMVDDFKQDDVNQGRHVAAPQPDDSKPRTHKFRCLPDKNAFAAVVKEIMDKADRQTICTDDRHERLEQYYRGDSKWRETLDAKAVASFKLYAGKFELVVSPVTLGGGSSIQAKLGGQILVKFSQLWAAISECHAETGGHCGIKPTFKAVKSKYTGIPRSETPYSF